MEDNPPVESANAPDEPDAALIAETLAGRTAAFDILVRRYHRQAVARSYRLLSRGEDAQDVAQEAFLKAYRSLDRLKDPERFGPWLMKIVTNLSLNARRARRGGGAGATLSMEDMIEHVSGAHDADGPGPPRTPQPSDEPQSAELRTAVEKAIDGLPENQRTALVLFSIEGIPQKEVAEIMECSVELVKWNVFQARKRLREVLAEYL
jgi:RNA polymerase sigma-70 factor (ECF subfamily)